MLLNEIKPRDVKAELMEKARKLREQAKQHRQTGAWIDAYRLENRARILEGKANGN